MPIAATRASITPTEGLPPGYVFPGIPVSLGDIVFNQVDQDGVEWFHTGLDGWDAADTVGDLEQRSQGDGADDAPYFYAPRALTLTGFLQAPSRALRDAARDRLQRNVPISLGVDLTVQEFPPKVCRVKRSGRLLVDLVTETTAEFSIGLVAPDPRKYAVGAQSVVLYPQTPPEGVPWPWAWPITFPDAPPSNVQTVNNAGDLDTPLVVRFVDSDVPLLYVDSLPGSPRVELSVSVPRNHYIEVDTLNGTVLLDGQVDYSTYLVRGSSLPLLPTGVSRLRYGGSSGTAQVTIASAWS